MLSFGTAGCNLACKFCQNWDISKSRGDGPADGSAASPEASPRPRARSGAASVAFTYNDPVIFAEYAMDTADACHALGIQTVAVTAGYMHAEPRREFYAKMDAANVDLKAFTEDFYSSRPASHLAAGAGHAAATCGTRPTCWFEITTLLIPGLNDSDAELDALSRWVAGELGPDVPLHFTAFHPGLQDDWTCRPRRPRRSGAPARSRCANGLHYVYTGNVHDIEGGTTLCPAAARR